MLPILFEASLSLFNHSDISTLGLPLLPSEQAVIYEAREDNNRFSHTSNLAVFQNRLYLMWSSGIIHEDAAGQVILFSVSDDGKTWSTPAVLLSPSDVAPDPNGSLMSSGWHVHGQTLNAYATYSTGSYADPSITRLTAITSTNGADWSAPVTVVPGTFLEGPRPAGNGRFVLLGQGENHKPAFYHTMDPAGLTGWTPAPIANRDSVESHWPEPSLFRRPDGTLVATIRTKSPSKAPLCAAESSDGGLTWTAGVTTFPDTIARTSAGNLPDGTTYLVSNPSRAAQRDVMTIALSRDGRVFDRAFMLLNNPPPLKFDGRAKFKGWQYPNAVIFREMMFIALTVGKEDVRVLRFPIALLKNPPLR